MGSRKILIKFQPLQIMVLFLCRLFEACLFYRFGKKYLLYSLFYPLSSFEFSSLSSSFAIFWWAFILRNIKCMICNINFSFLLHTISLIIGSTYLLQYQKMVKSAHHTRQIGGPELKIACVMRVDECYNFHPKPKKSWLLFSLGH